MIRIPNTLGRLVAYHGCDKSLAEDLLAGKTTIRHSNNDYDWLGGGSYFWVDSAARAAAWARYLYEEKKIKEPYVVGAFVSTGLCLNLLDIGVMPEIVSAHTGLCNVLSRAHKPIPKNTGYKGETFYHRKLDAAVFNYLHSIRKRSKLPAYDTILGAFEEGDQAYPRACFKEKTHVQLAVRNDKCILGYFRVRPN